MIHNAEIILRKYTIVLHIRSPASQALFEALQWAIPENIQPPPPRISKDFRISKNDNSSFCRIPNVADSKYWGIPEFCKTLNDFRGIPVKNSQNLGKFMDFQSTLLSIFYRISNVVHGGCVDIFWNSPIPFRTIFSGMQNVLKLCKTFSKHNCVSLITKWKLSSYSAWHETCCLPI